MYLTKRREIYSRLQERPIHVERDRILQGWTNISQSHLDSLATSC